MAVEKGFNFFCFHLCQSAMNIIMNTSRCFPSLHALLGTSSVNGQTWYRTFNRNHAIMAGV